MRTEERNENVESGEQVLRGGVALIMMETVLLGSALTPAIIAGLSVTALYMVFTAIVGWDPIYALAQGRRPAASPQAERRPDPPGRGIEASTKQEMAA